MLTQEPQNLHTATQVARRLGVHVRRVWALVADGDLPSVRFSPQGHHRFRGEDVDNLIERLLSNEGVQHRE